MYLRTKTILAGLKAGKVIMASNNDKTRSIVGLDHGQWIPWIEQNLPFGERQARKYIQCFESKERLNRHLSSDLSINEAVNLLSEPKPKREPKEPIKIEAELIDSEDYRKN